MNTTTEIKPSTSNTIVTSASGYGVNISAALAESGVYDLFVSSDTTRAQIVARIRSMLGTVVASQTRPSSEVLADLETAVAMAKAAIAWRAKNGGLWHDSDNIVADAFLGLGTENGEEPSRNNG